MEKSEQVVSTGWKTYENNLRMDLGLHSELDLKLEMEDELKEEPPDSSQECGASSDDDEPYLGHYAEMGLNFDAQGQIEKTEPGGVVCVRANSGMDLGLHSNQSLELDPEVEVKEDPDCEPREPYATEHNLMTNLQIVDDIAPTSIVQAKKQESLSEKPYACKICDKRFTLVCNLNKHAGLHTGVKSHACIYCDKMFYSISCLNYHMRIHTGEKRFTCDICDKKFDILSNFKDHIRTHTGEKPFDCKICNKKFRQKSQLNRHLRIHEKSYTCYKCQQSFIDNSNLKDHIIRVHPSRYLVKCTICNKTLANNSNLLKHMRIHTGEKPYACNVCNRKFSDSSTLNRHAKVHELYSTKV